MQVIQFLFVADHGLLTPVEYQALDTMFSAYNSKKIMDVWHSIYHMRVVTLHIVMQLLQSEKLTVVVRDLKGKFHKGMVGYTHTLSDAALSALLRVYILLFSSLLSLPLLLSSIHNVSPLVFVSLAFYT